MDGTGIDKQARRLGRILDQVAYTETALSRYDLSLLGIVPLERGFKLVTDAGPLVLRRFPGTPDRLGFVYLATLHLHRAGFAMGPRFLLTRDGLPCCTLGSEVVCVTTWVDGAPCDFARARHADAAASTLAEFHLKSAGFPQDPGPDVTPKVRLGEWKLEFPRLIAETDGLVSKAASLSGFGRTGLDKKVRQMWLYYRPQAVAAASMLEQARYTDLVEEARARRTLSHRSYRSTHVTVDRQGRVHLADLDECALDGPTSDLAALVRRSSEWDFGAAARVLEVYHSVNPLSWYQVCAALAGLMFPREFVRLVLRAQGALRGASAGTRKLRDLEEKLDARLDRLEDREPTRARFLKEFMQGLTQRRHGLRAGVPSGIGTRAAAGAGPGEVGSGGQGIARPTEEG